MLGVRVLDVFEDIGGVMVAVISLALAVVLLYGAFAAVRAGVRHGRPAANAYGTPLLRLLVGRRTVDAVQQALKRRGPRNVAPTEYRREPIPPSVVREVWRRDQNRCVYCGSQERLEIDHMIPVSRGGANTARNLQLLCERCNRSKGARI